jgi:chromate reductase, NAD(P)H dehydrogenase (quinone)
MAGGTLNVLGIPGSIRKGSYNRGLLEAAREVAPRGMAIEIVDLRPIPPYDADVEAAGDPEPVRVLKAQIARADALLFATPEYNHGMPGLLKNALDWASRPAGKSVLKHKPAAVMGASPGQSGSARAQLQLRQTLTATECYVLPAPNVLVASAAGRFDGQGRLTDEAGRAQITALLAALEDWVGRVAPRQVKAVEARPASA